MGILFGELVGIETLESRLREAVVAARSQIAAPGRFRIRSTAKEIKYCGMGQDLADQRQRRLIHSESKAADG